MSQEFYTVDDVASRLGLHPKTVLRLIGSGQLRATKIGKAYRIMRSDMEVFAGAPPDKITKPISVTSIIDVPNINRDDYGRLANSMNAVLSSRKEYSQLVHMETVFDLASQQLKIIIIGSSSDTMALIGAFETFWSSVV